jgi:SAM-dependent methyltransferase
MDEERKIREGVREAYSAASRHPRREHPFPVGREFAESLGYPRSVLDDLPEVAIEAFAGVSNVSVLAALMQGATVLDLGCGAGLDSLVAARRVGPLGRVVGIDFSAAMLVRANGGVRASGAHNIVLARAAAESLPLSDESIDVVLINGMFNLNPARTEIFEELARVVVPGGVVYSAELILKEPLPQAVRADEASWFA